MLVLNFSHPLTDEHKAQIETLAGMPIDEVRTIPVQINQSEPLTPQVSAIIDATQLSAQEWQTHALLINPPGYAPAAFVLLAELHGRTGRDPHIVSLRCRIISSTYLLPKNASISRAIAPRVSFTARGPRRP